MSIDDAMNDLKARIKAASKSAEIKVVKISEEEGRISVYTVAGEMQVVRTVTFQQVMDYLNKQGWDIQVLVYDRDHPPEIG